MAISYSASEGRKRLTLTATFMAGDNTNEELEEFAALQIQSVFRTNGLYLIAIEGAVVEDT